MEVLFSFLNWVASFSHVDEETGSKMDVHNLATVITPNILYTQAKAAMDESFLAIEAVHQLIEYNDTMCEVSTGCGPVIADALCPVAFSSWFLCTPIDILTNMCFE